jgi:hypothetical protein
VVENLDDCVGIFSARFPYVECHFRVPFASQSIKIFATRLEVVRASSRAALSIAAFTSLGIRAVRTTAGGGVFFARGGIAFPLAFVYVYLLRLSQLGWNLKVSGRESPIGPEGRRRRRQVMFRLAGAVPAFERLKSHTQTGERT